MGYKKIRTGFTIVELLIVIVVIAILAAISIVAYTGIQNNALNTARNSAARQTLTILNMYKATHGTLPAVPQMSSHHGAACLGGGWPTQGGDEICWNIYEDYRDSSTYTTVESVSSALAAFGTVPMYPQEPVWEGVTSGGRSMKQNGMMLFWQVSAEFSPRYPKGFSFAWTIPTDGTCDVAGATKHPFGYSQNDPNVCIVALGE